MASTFLFLKYFKQVTNLLNKIFKFMKEACFLISSERSGSNFITKIIDAHKEFCGPSPTHIIRTFALNCLRYGNLSNDKNWNELLKDVEFLINHQVGIWSTKQDFNSLKKNVKKREIVELINFIYDQERIYHKKNRLFIKENRAHLFSPFLVANYPDAKFIFLCRDPRDMCLSWKNNPAHEGGVTNAANIWKEDQENNLFLSGFLKDTKKILIVRYEDLTQNLEVECKRISKFLDVTYDPNMLKFYQNDMTKLNSEKFKAWSNLSKKVIKNNSGKFKEQLDKTEIEYIEGICYNAMNTLGYKPIYAKKQIDNVSLKNELINNKKYSPEKKLPEEEALVRKRRLDKIHDILNKQLALY
ncbi:MAG: hypothetical protein ACI9IL_000987 [Rickettsiales bacterium]|jgi:hypothetical protein